MGAAAMTIIIRWLAFASALLAAGSVVLIVAMSLTFGGSPTTLLPEAGEVVAFGYHGNAHYITRMQHLAYLTLWLILLLSFVLPAYVSWKTKPSLTWGY